uniref:hypothetical protein n=1 Tax=Dialister sp. TaxID=1955814 RepID=UPI00402A5B18
PRQMERENEMIVISHRLFHFFDRYAIMRNTLGGGTLADGEQGADSDLVSVGSSGLDRPKGQIV